METAQMPAFTPEEAVEQFGDTVFRAAFGLVKNPQDAEDIAQEVFLNLVRHAPRFDSAEHQKAWLLRCTINRCKSHFRSNKGTGYTGSIALDTGDLHQTCYRVTYKAKDIF